MATIAVTKSGTLNPTAGRIDNDDATTTTYAAGDTLSVYNNAQLKINTSTAARRPGSILANSTTSGTIFVENTSTTTPIVIDLTAQTSDIYVSGRSTFKVRGDWIVIKTGDGTASQTIDFSNIGGVSIDMPPCVWVETFDSTHRPLTVGGTPGYFMPFFNCYQTGDTLGFNILTEFYGDLGHGPVFQFNRTTKLATFGKGGAIGSSLGGAVIPNGARVLYQNIHFTSTVLDATPSARNEIRCHSLGSADISTCAFSTNWVFGRGASNGFYGSGDVSITNVSIGYSAQFQATGGKLDINGFAVGPSHLDTTPPQAVMLTAQLGETTVDYLFVLAKHTSTGGTAVRFSAGSGIKSIGSVWSWAINTAATADRVALYVDGITPPKSVEYVSVGPVYIVGGRFSIAAGTAGVFIKEINHSARCTAVADTVNSDSLGIIATSRELVVAKIRKLANGVPPRGTLVACEGDNYQVAVKDVVYDGGGNTQSSHIVAGARVYVTNMTCDNLRSNVVSGSQSGKSGNRTAGIRSNSVSLTNGGTISGGFVEWCSGNSSSYSSIGGADSSPFNCVWTNTDRTAGNIHIGPFSVDALEDHQTVISGTEGTDWYNNKTNTLFIEGNNVELIYFGTFPIRGITSFAGSAWVATGASYNTNATYELSMRLPNDTAAWGSWYDATTPANWQSALDALPGYSSNDGFFLRFRIKTTAALAGRAFQYARISCVTDGAWVPAEIGFVPVKVFGLTPGSTVRLMVNTVPASPVTVKIKTIAGSSDTLDFPYDFDGLAKDYRVVTRKPGYGEVSIAGSTYHAGRSVSVSQQQYVAVDEVAAAAITGVSINGATSTVTISANRSLSEVYAYCQWWAAQTGNMQHEIPLVTTNGLSYASSYNFTVADGVSITGTGDVDLGSKTLIMGAGAASTFDWTYGSGTKTWARITLSNIVTGSRVQVFDITGSVELFNGVAVASSLELQREWSSNRTIRVRATYCSGLSAKIPYVAHGVFGATGMSMLLAQADDEVYAENAIDGAGVTEFVADYANVQVDVSDGDGVTQVQRLYAWSTYNLTTANGIAFYFGAFTADDSVNYRINAAIVDIHIQNTSAAPTTLAGGRLYRSDGTTIFTAGVGPIQADPGRAFKSPMEASVVASTVWSSDTRSLTTAAAPTKEEVAAAVLAAAQTAPIKADVGKVSGVSVKGSGTEGDPWGPV